MFQKTAFRMGTDDNPPMWIVPATVPGSRYSDVFISRDSHENIHSVFIHKLRFNRQSFK